MAFLSARPASSGAIGDVRGFLVCRPVCHDLAARVLAGALRTLGAAKGEGDLAAVVWLLRRFRCHAVCLPTLAQTDICVAGCCLIFFSCVGVSSPRQEI